MKKSHSKKHKRVAGFVEKSDAAASTERAFMPMDEDAKAHNARHGGDGSFFADEPEHKTREEPQAIEPDEIIEPERDLRVERAPDARHVADAAVDADDRSR